jgi:arsenate reductase-like glutaredoxin family protein
VNHGAYRLKQGEIAMNFKRTKHKPPAKEYLEKAQDLSKKDAERLLARMRGRFARRLEDNRFTAIEALALQLEFEDEQLMEWRKNLAKTRDKRKD